MRFDRKCVAYAALLTVAGSGLAQTAPAPVDSALVAAVASTERPANDRARDNDRHPIESLSFWGLKPGMTIVDLQPEGGYFSEILAPYAAYAAMTGGVYVAGVSDPNHPWGADLQDANLPGAKNGHPLPSDPLPVNKARYGTVRYVTFNGADGLKQATNSADIIFVTREIHNWLHDGYADTALKSCYRALKPGGIFAVEEHRADPKDPDSFAPKGFSGYVKTDMLVAAARKAGFVLDGAAEINANSKDTKDYPFGVWTLKPGRLSALPGLPALTPAQRAAYDAIGESDRMTLRFRKPG